MFLNVFLFRFGGNREKEIFRSEKRMAVSAKEREQTHQFSGHQLLKPILWLAQQ
jgi:hypothetical protein